MQDAPRTPFGTPMAHIPSKTKAATVKMTPEQYRLIEQRAKRRGVLPSVWMRSILLQAATSKVSNDERGRGFLHIREPDGATT